MAAMHFRRYTQMVHYGLTWEHNGLGMAASFGYRACISGALGFNFFENSSRTRQGRTETCKSKRDIVFESGQTFVEIEKRFRTVFGKLTLQSFQVGAIGKKWI